MVLVHFWNPGAVGFEEVVAEGDDLVDGEVLRGVGIEHGGLIDVLFFAGEGGFDGE